MSRSSRKLAGVLISAAAAALPVSPPASAAGAAVNGGDAMYTVSPGPGREPYYCSAGFAVLVKQVRYLRTAGHCTEHGLDWKAVGRNVDSRFPVTDYGRVEDPGTAGSICTTAALSGSCARAPREWDSWCARAA
ncbi:MULTISPECIES: S1 family peptidase [Amycolatopsis]|uniref:Uncharacterized protein n=1 Tax=Amycolatopsis rubida TaxID=112413 RepID=A0A1I5U3M9_9PSEU|nr:MULTISPECIES: S1 family peptidase [Amycolatopsis]OAP23270.1 hypothetical protein A4R44_05917 [Amycolatopsis sp. M39]SFP89859.1 hypothetical protein SAMN05421854_107381 [Amycolatopsis rubida]